MGLFDRFKGKGPSAGARPDEGDLEQVVIRGIGLLQAGQIAEARAVFEDGLAAAQRRSDRKLTRVFGIQVATCLKLSRPPEHEQAIAALGPVLSLAESDGDDKAIAVCLLMIGESELKLSRAQSATSTLMRAAEAFKNLGDERGLNDAMRLVMQAANAGMASRRPVCNRCGGPLTALPAQQHGSMSTVGYKCMACFPA